MPGSFKALSPVILAKLEVLGYSGDIKFLIDNQENLKNPFEQLAAILNQTSSSTASLRAPEGYHLPKIMQSLDPALLDKFGGHPCAAGFSTKTDNLPAVKKSFLDYLSKGNHTTLDTSQYQKSIPKEIVERISPTMKASLDKNLIYIDYKSLNSEFLGEVFLLEPFGIDFPFPYFLFELPNQFLSNRKVIGQKGNHIKLTINNGLSLTFFNLDLDLIADINNSNKDFIILAKISQNTWNNATKLELIGESISIG